VYWLGPMGGAICAAGVYEYIFRALRPDGIEAQALARERKSREGETHKENGVAPEV